MATSDEILARQEAAITALETATDAITSAAADIKAAPRVAGEALETAEEAVETAEEAKEIASGALPKTGGELTGPLSLSGSSPAITQKNTSFEKGNIPASSVVIGNMAFREAQNKGIGNISCLVTDVGRTRLLMRAQRNSATSDDYADININMDADGTSYATAPPPRNNDYGNDIVIMKTLKDYAQKVIPTNAEIFIDAINGSDTADLFTGRGLSADKAFKSLPAAYRWAARYLTVPLNRLLFRLLSDITLTEQLVLNSINSVYIQISGDVPERKITCKGIGVEVGNLMLSDLHIQGDGSLQSLVWAGGTFGNAYLRLGSLQFSGTVTQGTVKAQWGGAVSAHGAFTGTVNGPRYYGYKGGRILTGNGSQTLIPGTEAGVLDATSIYA